MGKYVGENMNDHDKYSIPSPDEIRRKLESADTAVALALTAFISQKIRDATRFPTSISSTKMPTTDTHIMDVVFKKFFAAGWVVTHKSDQREGDYITIDFRK